MAKAREVMVVNTRSSRKVHHRSKKMTIPAAVIAGFVPLALYMHKGWQNEGATGALNAMVNGLTGYSPLKGVWWLPGLQYGAVPIAAGFLVHKLANVIGINRAMSRANIPLIRI